MGGILNFKHSTVLIPSLPNDVSLQILARVPRVYYLQLKLVSRSWMETLSSTGIYKLRKELDTTEELLFIICHVEKNLLSYALDPVSQIWQKLPQLPHNSTRVKFQRGLSILLNSNTLGSRIKIAEAVGGDPLDKIPLIGCSIEAVNGCLYVIGGFSMRYLSICEFGTFGTPSTRPITMRCVWRYDPILNVWNEVSPMLSGRAYSKTAVINNKLYVVGGITMYKGDLTGLQSAEVFDPVANEWSAIPSMPCSKGQDWQPDPTKETGLTLYNGKLYAAKILGFCPFNIEGGGELYDPEINSWVELSIGIEGWPHKDGIHRLSVVVDGELYALDMLSDPGHILGNVKIKVYDKKSDSWKVFSEEVPKSHSPVNLEAPCLLSNFGGKLHAIVKDANSDIAVLEVCSSLHHSHSAFSSSEVSWKVVASMAAGPADLICCQVLRI